ncbi:helix-turn-helix domain-containing protein [Kitasatospora sp. NPDC005748]|uniref:helix-turn-helix domain-containing protein n=1 Tax=Kitasatospora sp. NPDC005748 TaxID=3157063 RepID=UPI0033E37CB3
MLQTSLQTLPQPYFGIRLRTIRQNRGISQAQLTGPGMSAAYLSRLESGSRPPTDRAVAYLCDKLDLPLSSFQAEPTDRTAETLAMVVSGSDAEDATRMLLDTVQQGVPTHPALRWQSLWMLAENQRKSGARQDQQRTLQSLTELSDQIEHPHLQVRARVQLARCQRSTGDVPAAHRMATEAYALATEHQLSRSDLTRTLLVLISVEAETGRLVEALDHTDQVLRLVDELPVTLRAETFWTAGSIRIRQGRHAEAAALLEQAMDLLGAGNEELVLWMRLRLAAASLYLRMDPRRTDQAERRLREAAPAVELLNLPVHQQEFLTLRAHLAFHQDDHPAARELCERLGDHPEHLSFRDRVRHLMLRNQLRILNGERDAAIRELEQLAQQAQEAANIDLASEVWRSLAVTLAQAERPA